MSIQASKQSGMSKRNGRASSQSRPVSSQKTKDWFEGDAMDSEGHAENSDLLRGESGTSQNLMEMSQKRIFSFLRQNWLPAVVTLSVFGIAYAVFRNKGGLFHENEVES